MQWPERNKKLTFAGFNGSMVRQMQADMAELADALDLGSSGRPCRFDSCYPHKEDISTEDTVFVASFLFRKMDRRTRNVHKPYINGKRGLVLTSLVFPFTIK